MDPLVEEIDRLMAMIEERKEIDKRLLAEREYYLAHYKAVGDLYTEVKAERDRLQHFQTNALVSIGALQIEKNSLRAALEQIADECGPQGAWKDARHAYLIAREALAGAAMAASPGSTQGS